MGAYFKLGAEKIKGKVGCYLRYLHVNNHSAQSGRYTIVSHLRC